MDTIDPARFIFASFFVLGLLGLLAVALRYYSKHKFASNTFYGGLFSASKQEGRIEILETRYIDSKSKLILVKLGDVEHLLSVGENGVAVIESGIRKDDKNI